MKIEDEFVLRESPHWYYDENDIAHLTEEAKSILRARAVESPKEMANVSV
jgi:hypothetical protein